MTLPIIERVFPGEPDDLLPAVTSDNEPYWTALARGELLTQSCTQCARLRFPVMPVCPYCGSTNTEWRALSGEGEVFSWVRYHRCFLQEFADLIPYVVITAQLDRGVRIIGRLLERDVIPVTGMPVTTILERWPGGRCVPVFSLSGAK